MEDQNITYEQGDSVVVVDPDFEPFVISGEVVKDYGIDVDVRFEYNPYKLYDDEGRTMTVHKQQVFDSEGEVEVIEDREQVYDVIGMEDLKGGDGG